jgi:glycine/D-amino acid oxidase-like deaminating enzyme
MRETEFIIVGQGISGTFLSWYLQKEGRSFVVIDDQDPSSSSRVAAGIINPVTGRRIVKTWMIETILPFALEAYTAFGNELGINAILQKNIIDFFPSPQMLIAFKERVEENAGYLSISNTPLHYLAQFNYDFGYGEIDPCYSVQMQSLLPAWKKNLRENLIEERFETGNLLVQKNEISYKDLRANKIIFCDGISSSENIYFKNLPFALNKGEALIIRSKDLPADKIYKKAITLVPLIDDLFWVGSSHEWNFENPHPSAIFYQKTKSQLEQWLKLPFTIEAHLASVRPATIERRPFVGMHPHFPCVGILNGMGTKGCSLAPYFAAQFVSHLTKNTPILPEANVSRFTRILQPSTK